MNKREFYNYLDRLGACGPALNWIDDAEECWGLHSCQRVKERNSGEPD